MGRFSFFIRAAGIFPRKMVKIALVFVCGKGGVPMDKNQNKNQNQSQNQQQNNQNNQNQNSQNKNQNKK